MLQDQQALAKQLEITSFVVAWLAEQQQCPPPTPLPLLRYYLPVLLISLIALRANPLALPAPMFLRCLFPCLLENIRKMEGQVFELFQSVQCS